MEIILFLLREFAILKNKYVSSFWYRYKAWKMTSLLKLFLTMLKDSNYNYLFAPQ